MEGNPNKKCQRTNFSRKGGVFIMILPALNRSLSEKVFVSVYNIEGSTITTGLGVAYHTLNSMDGVNAQLSNGGTNDYQGFIGVAVKDIANNDYGLVQVQGYVNSILLSNVGSSLTINAGDPLVPAPAGFFSGAPTYANSGFKFVFASNVPVAVSGAAYASGLMKLV
jgi:hypothetical protein